MRLIVTLITTITSAAIAWLLYEYFFPPDPPHLDPKEWWGPKELQAKQNLIIRPFKIVFNDTMIADLRHRLTNHRADTKPLEGAAFTYGFNSDQLDIWTNYWANEYPFKAREQFLNKFPQFKTNIQGLDIHFIRVKPKVTGLQTVPLLLLHGWPGSVREFYEAIPLLTIPQPGFNFVFEVIVPSLPGFGFSDGPVRPGLGPAQTAVIFRNLMHRLGHMKFYIQGGDWGARITSDMATMYPDDVLGHHSNMLFSQHKCSMIRILVGSLMPSLIVDSHLADRMYPLSSFFAYIIEEYGYFHIQATKPDSIGIGLQDSPTGLLAYIFEKISTVTRLQHKYRNDGGLTIFYTREQLIDNLMMYWSSKSVMTSTRFYAAAMMKENRALNIDRSPSRVPTWGLQAKDELIYQPPNVLKLKFWNLLNTTVLEDGGHFIALEKPKVFTDDVYKAVDAFRKWHDAKKKTEL